MSALLSQHVRTLSSFDILIPRLKNPPKDIDKNTNSPVRNPTKRYWLCLHFVLDGQYICTREIGLEYIWTPGTQSVCTIILWGKEGRYVWKQRSQQESSTVSAWVVIVMFCTKHTVLGGQGTLYFMLSNIILMEKGFRKRIPHRGVSREILELY